MPDHTAFIAVGSNIDPEQNIPRALKFLAEMVTIEALSTFYRTEPIGRPEQPPFLNGVVRGRTGLAPRILKFDVLRRIEERLGRARTSDPYAARTIDLDLVLYDAAIMDEPGLRIPDPDIRERPFLAGSLIELNPGLVLPDTGTPLAEAGCLQRFGDLVPEVAFSKALKERLGL
jgi:2-amino-4-hydroxy-6-hydroxymethyldihydropteridine diphosphokinase